MMPLWTTTTRFVQSRCGWGFSSVGRAWVAQRVSPGPHYVTDDLYRACHTLRGASRTAESPECIRLADPLHRWLRRLFDSDRPFDDEGLATLADSVAVFEDIVDNTRFEQSLWSYVDVSYVFKKLFLLRLRYDNYNWLDQRDSTLDRIPRYEHRLRLELEARF